MYDDNFLMHHGVKGQKWGVRNYQNPDGTLTEAGRKRYLNDPTGKFDRIKSILSTGGSKVSSGIRRYASNKKEAFIRKHKPASQMSDAELNENLNRMRKEQELKRMRDELSGKKPKQSFSQKHPILQQVFVSTATNVASDLVKNQLNVKMDEILAPKRMARAKEKGLLNEEMFPFLSKTTSGRNSSWNNYQKKKTEAAEKAKEAAEKAKAKEHNDWVNKYHLRTKKDTGHRVKINYDKDSGFKVAKPSNGNTTLRRSFMSKSAYASEQKRKKGIDLIQKSIYNKAAPRSFMDLMDKETIRLDGIDLIRKSLEHNRKANPKG